MWIVIIIIAIIVIAVQAANQTEIDNNTKQSNTDTLYSRWDSKQIKPYKTEFGKLNSLCVAFDNNLVWCGIVNDGAVSKESIISNFTTKNYVCCLDSWGDSCCVMADTKRKVLAIVKFETSSPSTLPNVISVKQINFSSIVAVEQIKNGSTIYQKSTSGAIGRALVGGVLAGGAGAIVGGSTAKQKGEERCTSLLTKIQLNDITNPSFEVVWVKIDGEGFGNIESLPIYAQAQQTLDMIKAIIATNEAVANEVTQVDSSSNVADEIIKLHKLMTDNIITKEEFEAQKKKILNS
ncbi:MAG: SHOCT domain-containing protein [Rikenellaceae bacterium]